MQPRFSPSRALRRLLLLCLLPAAFAACDRHPAGEPPDNYGHGSTHDNSYGEHRIDSSGDRHFSDSAGGDSKKDLEATGEKHDSAEAPKRLNP